MAAMTAGAFVSAPVLSSRSKQDALGVRLCHRPNAFSCKTQSANYRDRRLTRASLKKDFLAGPEEPGFPRKLTQTVAFSSATGLLWYGWYKVLHSTFSSLSFTMQILKLTTPQYCIEEELRSRGLGRGALFALGPFTLGLFLTAFVPRSLASWTASFAVAWIVGIQFTLYRRINALFASRNEPEPLNPHWVVLPGLNLIAGLRGVHFLAVFWARERGESEDDWLAARLPFLGTDTLTAIEFFTSPRLWVNLG